jgi:ubiquinone/menaquinone biosynthesis C-methylase UbiE
MRPTDSGVKSVNPVEKSLRRGSDPPSHPEDIVRKRSAALSEQIPSPLANNFRFYTTPEAVDEYSLYRLFPEEKHLFAKYYKPGDRILDLGCGLGRTTLILHEMGLSVKGIDASEVFINIAKRRFPYLDLQVGSFDCLEEPDCAYSHVLIAFNGLDLAFPESQRVMVLRECARVLQPGGTLIFSSHNIKSLHYFSPRCISRVLWRLRNGLKAFKTRAYVLDEGLYGLYASPEFVIQQTENAGLKFLEMVGFKLSTNWWYNRYFSSFVHYTFRKPPVQPPETAEPPAP